MAKTKITPRKNHSGILNLSCTICGKTLKSLHNLKRHIELKHSSVIFRYYCEICRNSYCRKDVTKRHIIRTHSDTEFSDNLISKEAYNPRESATKITKWIPPPESRPKPAKNWKPTFRIIPADKYNTVTATPIARIINGKEVPTQGKPIEIKNLDELLDTNLINYRDCSYQSTSTTSLDTKFNEIWNEINATTTNEPPAIEEYHTINYQNEDTICLDELPKTLWNREIYIHRIYGLLN